MPFLTVVTRCCKRPHMLTLNVQSVLAQTDHDVEQVFIVDHDQRGVPVANRSFALNKHRIEGDYVYILDDDTRLIDKGFVARLKPIAKDSPDVIMVKSSRPQLAPRILPKPFVWNCPERLALGSTNCLCYVVRREVWLDHIEAFAIPAAGDWHFLNRLRNRGATFAWIDLIVAETQQLGRGRLFEECGEDWFQQVAQKWGFQELKSDDWRLSLYAQPEPHTFWKTEPGEVIQQGSVTLSGLLDSHEVAVPEVKVISVEHTIKRPKAEPKPVLPVPKSKYVLPEAPIVTLVPEPVLPVPAHSLLSRRRKRK